MIVVAESAIIWVRDEPGSFKKWNEECGSEHELTTNEEEMQKATGNDKKYSEDMNNKLKTTVNCINNGCKTIKKENRMLK